MSTGPAEDRTFEITRVFEATRDLVYTAWTRPEHLKRWWGPNEFTVPVFDVDLRPGGAYRFVMRAPDSSEFPARGVYLEIAPNERLVFDMDHSGLPEGWHDAVNPGRDRSLGRPKFETLVTVTFADEGPGTRLTIRMTFESPEVLALFAKAGVSEGWSQSLDRLENVLKGG